LISDVLYQLAVPIGDGPDDPVRVERLRTVELFHKRF